jgi:hypothetical protein
MAFCNVLIPNKILIVMALVSVTAATALPPHAMASSGHVHHHRKPCQMTKSHDVARAEFNVGRVALDAKKFADAITAFDKAIAEIGSGYSKKNANIIDDTGTKLTLAQVEQKRGNLAVAANLKSRVVESRLSLLTASTECAPK